MGREDTTDPVDLNSSIALLQERFKQLQRVREMRKERQQLHRSVVVRSPSVPLEQPKWLFPGAASGRLHHQSQTPDTSLSMSLWPHATPAQSSSTSKEADVDTSLHLTSRQQINHARCSLSSYPCACAIRPGTKVGGDSQVSGSLRAVLRTRTNAWRYELESSVLQTP
ncbi:hypothetical protein BHE74_00044807 [Ensete ventricosum]|uniref:Uncharacterized protein n=2 Tax=Ensete ventricosum TaxID=4639 RepID=A0A427A7F4_ENSVE|nr:hypothetical protein B296_00013309 [Ensete ventricosum]RWW49067.1 hypothetical protein BHE74_00044807 [Ensete ventricosum]